MFVCRVFIVHFWVIIIQSMSFFEMQYLHIFMQTWIRPISMHLYYHCLHSVDVIVIMNEPRYVNLGFAKSLHAAVRMMNMMLNGFCLNHDWYVFVWSFWRLFMNHYNNIWCCKLLPVFLHTKYISRDSDFQLDL